MSAAIRGAAGEPLPPHEYAAFTTFLRRQAGIDLDQYRRRQMERRIRAFAGTRGAASLVDYAELLRAHPAELSALLDRISVRESRLFRGREQWDRLGTHIVPDLSQTGHGRIRAWNAGCSSGADAYSLASTVLSAAPGARLEIRASDVDRRVLTEGGRTVFTLDDARSAPPALLERYFVAVDGGWLASEELLAAVHFHHEDLLAVEPAAAGYDLVLCRGVAMQLTRAARENVHSRMARSLRPGGYVVVGSTERIELPLDQLGLELVWPCAYRKVR